MSETPAVVLDLNKTGTLVARCLGRAGIAVTGVHTHRQPAIGAASRYVTRAIVRPELTAPEVLRELAQLAGPQRNRAALLCATDEAVDFCSRARAALIDRFHVPEARPVPLHQLLDKDIQASLAARCGLAVPPSIAIRRGDGNIAASLRAVPLPAIVKPGTSLLGYKRFMGVEDTHAGLEARVAATLPQCPYLMVSAYVPGPASANFTVMGLGRGDAAPVITTVTRKLRQVPRLAFGSASLAEVGADDELAVLAAAFIQGTGVTGPFELEFKRESPAGPPWFIEANFRFSALVDLTVTGDTSLPHLVWLHASGGPIPERPSGSSRLVWVDELRDWKLAATGQLALDELLAGYRGVNRLSLYAPDDPAPFGAALEHARSGAGAHRALFETVLRHLLSAVGAETPDTSHAGAALAAGVEGAKS